MKVIGYAAIQTVVPAIYNCLLPPPKWARAHPYHAPCRAAIAKRLISQLKYNGGTAPRSRQGIVYHSSQVNQFNVMGQFPKTIAKLALANLKCAKVNATH